MTYFSNGTEGHQWEADNCPGCVHAQEEAGCPVLNAHYLANHDQHGKDPKAAIIRDVLAMLIPREGVFSGPCAMLVPVEGREAQVAMVKAKEELEVTRRTVGWMKRYHSEAAQAELAEQRAKAGEEPPPPPVTLQALQEDRRRWAADRFPLDSGTDQAVALANVMEEVGELARVHRLHVDHPELDVAKLKAERVDAVGDIVIATARYATAAGLDLEDCVLETWRTLRSRPIDTPRRSYRPEWRRDPGPDGGDQ